MKLNTFFRKKSISEILLNKPADVTHAGPELNRVLGLKDIVAMGIAAIIGAGIFSTIGNASFHGGPAVTLLFVFTAIACGFSALCYAQFASILPISGSSYTYAYTTFGELVAWIIGWDLIMEYSVGNIAVAISWSDYFTSLLDGLGLHIPIWLQMDMFSAFKGFNAYNEAIVSGAAITADMKIGFEAWMSAPKVFGYSLVFDLPALMIVIFVTRLCYIGISESRKTGNMLVLFKLAIIFMVLVVGAFYIKPENWNPFAPNGITGVLKGVSAVFFAYIGFDAISTTAEECKDPQRDLPKGMIYSLVICTVLYIAIALVLTGMVPYTELNVGDPLAFVFERVGLNKFSGIIAVSAVIAMTSVLLVFQLGQPRIWMSMSRDGLLPKKFSKIHPKYKTPGFSTIITGIVVGVPALFMNLTSVTDLTSIGTLFAFALVCGGILVLDKTGESKKARFKIPFVNSKYIIPLMFIAYCAYLFLGSESWINMWSKTIFIALQFDIYFTLVFAAIAYSSFRESFSLIPVLGLLSTLYLMSKINHTNWIGFIIWMVIGLIVYGLFGYKHSKLALK